MSKSFLIVAAILGGISVVLGAFAAHGLKKILPADSITTFETGVRYQFYHAFALLVVGILLERTPSQSLVWAGYCFVAGVVLFSGSLYLLAMLKSTGTVGLQKAGIITPIGGLFFVAGWLLLVIALVKRS
jgi:uncharacterized membrane protein YgdD (TMEM256/DUF423 family)